jgi:hypothetical protein
MICFLHSQFFRVGFGGNRRVVSLSLSGQELWVSPSLEGLSPGTPVVSEDGAHVFLTHNSADGTVGHFTILDGTSGEIFFSQLYESAPFAPLGIYYNPAEGYYDGGENNRNDILVWSVGPKPNETSVGPGATFAFQFPIDFASHGDTSDLTYAALGNDVKDFQAIQKPVLTNEGRTLYWGTSRSQLRCWLGEEGMDRYRFSRARTSAVSFTRGTPAMQSVYATPALSNGPLNRSVFGGTASAEFVKVSGDCGDHIVVPTGHLVKSTARVSPDDTYVYYLETDGILHQASTVSLQDEWTLDIGGATEGEFSLNQDGTLLYVGDASGLLRAYRVGDVPTPVPVVSGSAAPSFINTTFDPTAMALDRPPSLGPTRGPAPIRPPASSLTSQPTKTSGDNGSGTSNQESGVGISRQSVSFFFIAAAMLWVVAL